MKSRRAAPALLMKSARRGRTESHSPSVATGERKPLPPLWMTVGRFLKNPKGIGTLIPSSRFLARKMLEGVDWRPDVRIIEFGPGTGAITREIEKLLPSGGRYLGIELEESFVDHLRRQHPRLDFVCDSVEHLRDIARKRKMLPVHHIVCSLPFATLPAALTQGILVEVEEALAPGGTFTFFQYLGAMLLPPAVSVRRKMKDRFGPHSSRRLEFRNIPPAAVLTWRKPPES